MQKNKADIFDRLMAFPLLRVLEPFYKKHKSALLYVFFGGLTTLVSIVAFGIPNALMHINEHISNIISWICAVTFAYITNRIWVFQSTAKGTAAVCREAAAFYGGRLATLGIEEILLLVFVTWLHCNGMLIKIAAQFIVLVLNYFISKIIVFRNKKETKR